MSDDIDYETFLKNEAKRVTLTERQAEKLEEILMDVPKEKLISALTEGYNTEYDCVIRKSLWGE